MPVIDKYLEIAKKMDASDLHFTTGAVPTLRIIGELQPIANEDVITPEIAKAVIYEIMTEEQQQRFEIQKEIDFAYMPEGIARFRVTVFHQQHGIGAVFRLIPERIFTLEELNLPPVLMEFTKLDKGLVLVTGPTGCGKTTTLASLIEIINNKYRKHIVTIEDPIEFIHKSKKCLITQREVGIETESFADALKAISRQDVDIILVGEMRDLETISLTLHAAETGHMIFATVHTNSAVKTVDRIIDVFPEEEQNHVRYILSTTVRGIISQQLLPGKSMLGRVPAVEVMVGTPAVSNIIREGKTPQLTSIIQASAKEGMQTMDQSIVNLYKRGLITRETALQKLQDKSLLGHYR